MEQIASIARTAPGSRLIALPACRHSPHRDQPQAVLAAAREFVSHAVIGAARPVH
jgi:pimeloyl-ACP methyl ester carboxylesterase